MRYLGLVALLAAFPAQASHPLITEDTGVLGKGGWQLELHGEKSRDRAEGVTVRAVDASAVLSYGVTDKADLQAEMPYLREVTDSDVVEGRSDASVSVKWRFHESDNLSLVFKPDLFFPTGRDELGLGAGRVRWAANFVAGYTLGSFELLGHFGYLRNRNRIGERESLRHASAAVIWAATERLKLVLDLGRDTNPDPASRTAMRENVYGLMYAMTKDIDLGLGLKNGLSDPADDRAFLTGVKFRW